MKRTRHLVAFALCILPCSLAGLTGCAASPPDDAKSVGRGDGGVDLKRDADVFSGSSFACSRPAVFDYDKVKATTAEWKTIVAEKVTPGSARYQLLASQMRDAVRERVQRAALAKKCDLVVRAGDIRDARGLQVVDLTAEIVGG